MVDEVARMFRHSASGEVGRRTNHGHAEIARHRNGDHVFVDHFAELDACIESFRHDVERRLADDEIELDVRVVGEEAGDHRLRSWSTQHSMWDAKRTARLVPELAYGSNGRSHVVQRRSQ